jgi:hypothetical protein
MSDVLAHFVEGCFGAGRPPLPVGAGASCKMNVVAMHSASIVAPAPGVGFALIEMSLTLMIRGNLPIRSKKNPRS